MTEIPEHLLQRSRDRRAVLTGGEAAPPVASAATPAVAAASSAPAERAQASAPAVVKVAPPPPPHVQAALRRKKIPLWAMPVLLGMPIWAYTYVGTLERPPVEAEGLIAVGETIYAERCASCHGGSGGGIGSAPGFNDGAVVETFPNPLEHLEWVAEGSAGWDAPTYGSQGKPVASGMPAWAAGLTQEELLGVVFYERATLAGDEASVELAAHLDELIEADEIEGFEAEGNFAEDLTLEELDTIFRDALAEVPEG